MANLTSSSDDLKTFFEILVRMTKEESGVDIFKVETAYEESFAKDKERFGNSITKFQGKQWLSIKLLFEKLNHTSIIDLMKEVRFL